METFCDAEKKFIKENYYSGILNRAEYNFKFNIIFVAISRKIQLKGDMFEESFRMEE
jgi:hypothetical protein